MGVTARGRAAVHQRAGNSSDGILLPMMVDALVDAVDKGLDPDTAVKMAPEIVAKTMPSLARVLAVGLHRGKRELLKGLAEDRAALAAELDDLWGPAFATYEAIAYGAYELGADLCEMQHVSSDGSTEAADTSDPDQSPPVDLMLLLHGRACTSAIEILCLLRAGFADGASARQRTLHELAVVISLLSEHRNLNLACRYADYAVVEQHEDMRHFQTHAAALKQTPLTDEEVAAVETQYQEVLLRHGKDFARPYGWAAPLFLGQSKAITFARIEAIAQLGHLRPYYRQANHSVHAGPRAAALNLHYKRGTGGPSAQVLERTQPSRKSVMLPS